MKSRLLLILVTTFCISGFTGQSQVLYQNDSIVGFVFNPGLGVDGNPVIMFDDINIPNSRIGGADSIGITGIDLAIARDSGAAAVTVNIFITPVDPTGDTTYESFLFVPPILLASVDLPAGGNSTLIPLGDSINPFIVLPSDTSNFYEGFQTFFIGLSFSNDDPTNGWFFTGGPDINDDVVLLYDSLNAAEPTSATFFGGDPVATFYAVVYGQLIFANPTPVTLKEFNVTKRSNNENLVTWNTETENNSSEFIIERSKDGREFKELARIAAAGTSTTLRKYQFTDPAPFKGTNYYRLNSVDKDNKGKLSLIRSVRNIGETTINIYPNPVTNILRADIDAETAGKGFVSIFDLSGKQVFNRQVQIKEGVNPLSLNMSRVVRGNYVMKIGLNDKDVIVKQFTKQ